MESKNKLYISSLTFDAGTPASTSSSSCYRNLLLSHWGLRTDINPFYAELGALNEENWEKEFAKDETIEKFLREESLSIDLSDSSVLSGRYDVRVYYKDGTSEIVELKSMSSANTYKKVFVAGEPKIENVAQLCAYLGLTKLTSGKLIYTFYPKGDKPPQSKIFQVTLLPDGEIQIDGKTFLYTMHDLTNFVKKATVILENEEIFDRPEEWESSFASPCYFCTWKEPCSLYDRTQDKLLFLCSAFLTLWRKKQ